MKRLAAPRALFVACALLFALAAVAQMWVPTLDTSVTDLTGTLGNGPKAALRQTLFAFEHRKGNRITVLIVPSTAPETIEQYGLRVVEQWKLGRKGVDDGALLLIARDDSKVRIEVNHGLEGALNDAVCKRIIDEIIMPRLRQGDVYGGIAAGVERMIAVVDGEPLPAPSPSPFDSGNPRTELNRLQLPPGHRPDDPLVLPPSVTGTSATSPLTATAQIPVPALSARVTDLTAALGSEQKAALEQTLAAFEQRKGNQITVLIVPSTAPETIEQYGLRVAEQWKLSRKGVDDGALLLVAKDDRKLRIEVGYGLEGALSDAVCKRIIDEIIMPRFRQGDFHGGIVAGIERMIAVVDGEPLPAPSPSPFDSGNPSTELNRLQLPPDRWQVPRHRPDDSLVLPPSVTGQIPVPALSARVTDLTAALGSEQKAALEQTLAAFEQRKGSQIAVLLVPSTASETIEQYGLRVAEQWKLGRKGVDDGALLLVAKNDRKLRIEVGYGLEGALSDAVCKRIIDEIIVPRFRQGAFYGGIVAGIERMIAVVDGEALPVNAAQPSTGRQRVSRQGGNELSTPDALMIVFGSFTIGCILFLLRSGCWSSGGRRGGGGGFFSGGGGGFSGGGGSFGGGGASGGW